MNRSGTAARVLVVDDEVALTALVRRYLEREGFDVTVAHDGPSAIELSVELDPDLIVLDLMLPGFDGLEVARRLRERSDVYIIMLTAKTEESDRIVGLTTGADDYLVKPFSPGELVARVHAMLRRPRRPAGTAAAGDEAAPPLQHGELLLDVGARTVTVAGARVELTRTEFDLLDTLMSAPRLVFSKEQLIDRVWGSSEFRDAHLLATHVANLRRKLGDDSDAPRFIATVRGVGYRMAQR